MTRRAGEVQDYYISGSWESLMQGYGEIEWTKFKMIQIKEFMRDFDPSYIAYEEYEQNQMEMLSDVSEMTWLYRYQWKKQKEYGMNPNIGFVPFYDNLNTEEILTLKYLRAAQKLQGNMKYLEVTSIRQIRHLVEHEPEFIEIVQGWKIEYERELNQRISAFITKNTHKLTGHFNIVPADVNSYVSGDMVCYADFVKPTCKVELMMVSDNSSQNAPVIYQHPFVPQVNLKNLKRKFIVHEDGKTAADKNLDVFVKELSIFKPWKEDNDRTYEECWTMDFKYWKVDKICKDEYELKKCQEIIQRHYPILKQIYTTLISSVEYPCIGWMKFCSFCKECKLVDKVTPFSVIDRLFVAANYEIVDMQDNPDRAL